MQKKYKIIVTSATVECKKCGERITLKQDDPKISIPKKCKCGNSRSFDLIMRKLEDIEE